VTAEDVGGERSIADTRTLVREIAARGFRIGAATFDGFQSTDGIQQLRRLGFGAGVLSVDKNTEAYANLKTVINSKRLWYAPGWWCEEYAHLEWVKGKKVDHQNAGSVTTKDEADAVAGAVLNATIAGRLLWTEKAPERKAADRARYLQMSGVEANEERWQKRDAAREAQQQKRWAEREAAREKKAKGR
jgi:hypothetical protein